MKNVSAYLSIDEFKKFDAFKKASYNAIMEVHSWLLHQATYAVQQAYEEGVEDGNDVMVIDKLIEDHYKLAFREVKHKLDVFKESHEKLVAELDDLHMRYDVMAVENKYLQVELCALETVVADVKKAVRGDDDYV